MMYFTIVSSGLQNPLCILYLQYISGQTASVYQLGFVSVDNPNNSDLDKTEFLYSTYEVSR